LRNFFEKTFNYLDSFPRGLAWSHDSLLAAQRCCEAKVSPDCSVRLSFERLGRVERASKLVEPTSRLSAAMIGL
jgi:hypothetical protein